MDNATNRKQLREAEKRAKADHQRRGNVIKSICATEQGRRFIWEQLEECHIFAALYPDMPNLGAILGERNVGLRMLALVTEFCPNLFIKMMEEADARRQLNTLAATESAGSSDAGGDAAGPDDAAAAEWERSLSQFYTEPIREQ